MIDAEILNSMSNFNLVLTVKGDELFYTIKGKPTKQNDCNMEKCSIMSSSYV